MSLLNLRSFAALGGVTFVALDAVAMFLPGPPPRASDSAHEIALALAEHRSEVLAGMFVAGLSLIALLAFLAAIDRRLGAGSNPRGWFTAATGGALAGIAAQWVGLVLFYGATFQVAAEHHDAIVRALTDGGNAAIELSKFGFATLIAGVCVAGRRVLSTRMLSAGLAAAALLVTSAISLFSTGSVTEFGGGLDIVGSIPAILWLLALSVVLARAEAHGERAPRTELAPSRP